MGVGLSGVQRFEKAGRSKTEPLAVAEDKDGTPGSS